MRKWIMLGVLLGGGVSYPAMNLWAQSDDSASVAKPPPQVQVDSSMYLKAQDMVSNGDAEAGRALVDSLVKATPSGSAAQYAEGLYWRAKLSASATAAAKDYRRIIVDYSRSPRVADALLLLGQMEVARGQRDQALQHFRQLTLEHSDSPLFAAGSYWMARTLFELNDVKRGCAANADAQTAVKPTDIELKNQIDYQNQRCRGIQVAAADSAAQAQAAQTAQEQAPSQAAASSSSVVSADTGASDTTPPVTKKKTSKKKPSSVSTNKGTDSTPVTPAKTAGTGAFMVQVAAFSDKAQALDLVASLKKKGYAAHIDGTKAPYRVRVGHFTTRAKAAAYLDQLKVKHIDGFVTGG